MQPSLRPLNTLSSSQSVESCRLLPTRQRRSIVFLSLGRPYSLILEFRSMKSKISGFKTAAVNAAISLGERFDIDGPGVERISVSLGRNAQTNKGAIQLPDRKKPLRHLVGISEEFSTPSAATGRTLLADSRPTFVWSSLAQIHGLPGVPEWAEWFYRQLESHEALIPLLGIGCQPVLIKGNKQQFLSWLGTGVRSGALDFPTRPGPIYWRGTTLVEIFGGAGKPQALTGDAKRR